LTARLRRRAFLLPLILAACSKGPAGHSRARLDSVLAVAGWTQNACLRDVRLKDVAQILGSAAVVARPVESSAEACRFEGSNNTELVAELRSGEEVEPFWKLTITRNNDRMVPMAGVGDLALRLPDGSEVMARKGGFSCQAGVIGVETGGRVDALARSLGGLCNRLFSALRPRTIRRQLATRRARRRRR
jgi:hypothetical protein